MLENQWTEDNDNLPGYHPTTKIHRLRKAGDNSWRCIGNLPHSSAISVKGRKNSNIAWLLRCGKEAIEKKHHLHHIE
jgi:hypothetical protein